MLAFIYRKNLEGTLNFFLFFCVHTKHKNRPSKKEVLSRRRKEIKIINRSEKREREKWNF